MQPLTRPSCGAGPPQCAPPPTQSSEKYLQQVGGRDEQQVGEGAGMSRVAGRNNRGNTGAMGEHIGALAAAAGHVVLPGSGAAL